MQSLYERRFVRFRRWGNSFLLETRVTGDLPGCAIVRVRDEPALTALRAAEALLL